MTKKILTTHDISKLLKVDINTVQNWIKAEYLKAYKTPGGHRRIREKDFTEFASEFNLPVSKINGSPEKFLIVDDYRAVRKTLRKIIKKIYKESIVYEAADGFTAGTLLGSSDIKLMFLDIDMPEMNGFEVMKKIKENPSLGKPKIIVITGLPEEQVKDKVRALKADALILKPFDIGRVKDVIKEIFKS
ncbi:MAG: response regulator [Elusimicrobia bacterium]|jgi:excisionase family DNA binding protein|nr:response regulator [Elusimicrobiota bacterium]